MEGRVLREEDDVRVLQQELKDEFPALNWEDHIKSLHMVLILLKVVRAGKELMTEVINFLIYKEEGEGTRSAFADLTRTKCGHLLYLRSPDQIRKNKYFDIAHIIALISSLKLGHFCSATVSTLEL